MYIRIHVCTCTCTVHTGVKSKYFQDDLRKDARTMEFNTVVNKVYVNFLSLLIDVVMMFCKNNVVHCGNPIS